jgi:hypothetical protein
LLGHALDAPLRDRTKGAESKLRPLPAKIKPYKKIYPLHLQRRDLEKTY